MMPNQVMPPRFQQDSSFSHYPQAPHSNDSFSIGDQPVSVGVKRRSSVFIKDRLNYLKSRLNNASETSIKTNNINNNNMIMNPVNNNIKLQSKSERTLLGKTISEGGEQLRFFVTRHAERIDQAIGMLWYEKAFDQNGKYTRINLNLPNRLPFRADKRDFIGDSPITEIGKFQARLTGNALDINGYKINYCYVSPALRCIQTAHQILKAQDLDRVVKIRIEPSLFEMTSLYKKGLPKFLNSESLIHYGFNIDNTYKPLLPVDRLKPNETYIQFYSRSFNIIKHLSNLHQMEGGNVLVVGHAGTLEGCTRQITGSQIRSYQEYNAIALKVPYLGICLLEKERASKIFRIKKSGIPPLAHHANVNFEASSIL